MKKKKKKATNFFKGKEKKLIFAAKLNWSLVEFMWV